MIYNFLKWFLNSSSQSQVQINAIVNIDTETTKKTAVVSKTILALGM